MISPVFGLILPTLPITSSANQTHVVAIDGQSEGTRSGDGVKHQHVPTIRKQEWDALYFVFGWKVGEDPFETEARVEDRKFSRRGRARPTATPLIARDWNPEKKTRTAIEKALKEFRTDNGFIGLDFRTADERKRANQKAKHSAST